MPRCYGHDYRSRCIYHITLKKSSGISDFGSLSGKDPDWFIARSQLGSIIEKQIRRLPEMNPALRILQYSIMPDHVHLLLFVTSQIEYHLGNYIGHLKVLIHQTYREATGQETTVFQNDFYDCILYRSRSLDVLYRYLRENARRLAVRRAHPEFFRRVNDLRIGEKAYQAYGNFQLLDNPFKEQVVVHRADSPEVCRHNRDRWIYTAANGGILVSPFISHAEKAIRTEAEEAGGRFILITNEQMTERYKPSGHDFALCESGRLLIISAALPGVLSRQNCLTMNSIAKLVTECGLECD
jgi:hypothetical protein